MAPMLSWPLFWACFRETVSAARRPCAGRRASFVSWSARIYGSLYCAAPLGAGISCAEGARLRSIKSPKKAAPPRRKADMSAPIARSGNPDVLRLSQPASFWCQRSASRSSLLREPSSLLLARIDLIDFFMSCQLGWFLPAVFRSRFSIVFQRSIRKPCGLLSLRETLRRLPSVSRLRVVMLVGRMMSCVAWHLNL